MLQGHEVGALRKAIQAAYSEGELRMLLKEECSREYDSFAPGNASYDLAVYEVIQAADRQGWIPLLVMKASAARPGNEVLRRWQEKYPLEGTLAAPVGRSMKPRPVTELMDSAYFDLTGIRDAVEETLETAGKVIGFRVDYHESKFIEKLVAYLGDVFEAEAKTSLSLDPSWWTLDESIDQVRDYRPDLDAEVNVLLQVDVRTETIFAHDFWTGICQEFGVSNGRLILVFVCTPAITLPDELIRLPPPTFRRSDVRDWARLLVKGQGWPAAIGIRWSRWLCEKAALDGQPNGPLSSRRLYDNMDKSLILFRSEPDYDKFRATIQSWS